MDGARDAPQVQWHDVQHLASALLTHIVSHEAELRWLGRIKPLQFLDQLLPFVVALLVDPAAHSQGLEIGRTSAVLWAFRVMPPMLRLASQRKSVLLGVLNAAPPPSALLLTTQQKTASAKKQAEVVLSAIFLVADEENRRTISWDEFVAFLSDCAVSYSTQLGSTDTLSFVPRDEKKLNLTCSFAASICDTKILLVLHSSSTQEELRIFCTTTGNVLAKSLLPHTFSAIEPLHDRSNLIACCAEIALVFVDAKNCREVHRLGFDVLSETTRALHWSVSHRRLYAGGMSGSIWVVQPPTWDPRQFEWSPPRVDRRISVVNDSIVRLHFGVTEGLLFAVTSRGALWCCNILSEKKSFCIDCSDFGMHLCTGMVYNRTTNYVVCCGESNALLAFVGRNVPSQSPMKVTDNVCPHTSRVIGVVTDSTCAMIASIDTRGVLKVWDLSSLRCTQTIRVPMSQKDFVSMLYQPQRLIVVLQRQVHFFVVDTDLLSTPVQFLAANPRGGTVIGAVGNDIIEWRSNNGRIVQHHSKVSSQELAAVACVGGTNTLYVASKDSQITFLGSLTKKPRSFQGTAVIVKSEPVGLALSQLTQRIAVATVNSDVWFLSISASQSDVPVRATLQGGDTTATCIVAGSVDSTAFFYIGTAENSINIFTFVNPGTAKFVARLPPPLNAEGEEQSDDQVTVLLFSEHSIVCGDSAGSLRVYLASTRSLSCDRTILASDCTNGEARSPNTSAASASSCYATAMANYIPGSCIVVGDSVGFVRIFYLKRRADLSPVFSWKAHSDPICAIAIDDDVLFTSTTTPNVSVWNLDGALLSVFWGPNQMTAEVAASKPEWFDDLETRIKYDKVDDLRRSFNLYINVSNVAQSACKAPSRKTSLLKAAQCHAKLAIDSSCPEPEEETPEYESLLFSELDGSNAGSVQKNVGSVAFVSSPLRSAHSLSGSCSPAFGRNQDNAEDDLTPPISSLQLPVAWKKSEVQQTPREERQREFTCSVGCLGMPQTKGAKRTSRAPVRATRPGGLLEAAATVSPHGTRALSMASTESQPRSVAPRHLVTLSKAASIRVKK